jgi:hypothetical protein
MIVVVMVVMLTMTMMAIIKLTVAWARSSQGGRGQVMVAHGSGDVGQRWVVCRGVLFMARNGRLAEDVKRVTQ